MRVCRKSIFFWTSCWFLLQILCLRVCGLSSPDGDGGSTFLQDDDMAKIFWGWWKPTTSWYPPPPTSATTTPQPSSPPADAVVSSDASTISSNASPSLHHTSSDQLLESSSVPPQTSTLSSTVVPSLESTSEYSPSSEPTDSNSLDSNKYAIYWNVPSFQCHKYGLNFSRVAEWGLQQNAGDEFRGESLAILYDPGEFPALLPAVAGRRVSRNGGVPQEASLSRHLTLFAQHMDKLIPNHQFSGLGVIDFEHWRPVWRQMWGPLAVYRDYSRLLERRRHPYWFSSLIESEAIFKYELAARSFLVETLKMAKRLRPAAKWGYYGYPFCFNYTPNNNRPTCSDEVQRDNDDMWWLFDEMDAYFPSLYLKADDDSPGKRLQFVEGRLTEAMRLAGELPVYPYLWYKYHDTNQFLSEEDMKTVLERPLSRGCRGAVIWGASRDVNTKEKCLALADYLDKVIGPAVRDILSGQWSDRADAWSYHGNISYSAILAIFLCFLRTYIIV